MFAQQTGVTVNIIKVKTMLSNKKLQEQTIESGDQSTYLKIIVRTNNGEMKDIKAKLSNALNCIC